MEALGALLADTVIFGSPLFSSSELLLVVSLG